MRNKKLLIVLATALALMTLIGGTVAFAAVNVAQPAQQAVTDEVGLVLVSIDPEGPAAAAGAARGDILLSIDGQETNNASDLAKALAGVDAGDDVTLVVTHGDDQRTLTVTTADKDGRAYLGIQPYYNQRVDRDMMAEMAPMARADALKTRIDGALVMEVVEDSPAALAGLETGDVIVSVDGLALDNETSLADVIGALQPEAEVALEVQRAGAEDAVSLTATLGENPDKAGAAYLGVRYRQTPGMAFQQAPFGQGQMPNFHGQQLPMPEAMPFHDATPFDLPDNGSLAGAVVVNVASDSPAAEAGLAHGDVIVAIGDVAVESPAEVVKLVSEMKPGDTITLSVQRSGQEESLDIAVTLGARPDDDSAAYLGVELGMFRAQWRGNAAPGQSGQSSPSDLLQQLFPNLMPQQNSQQNF